MDVTFSASHSGRADAVPGSYDRAMRFAGETTRAFLKWAHDNMTCECRNKLFKS
jgi:hypothetical protein